jgi:hypothetical protein
MTPQLRVDKVRQIFNDGNHNAFTDLCRFGDHIYLTFRSCPDGHMLFTSSRIVILRSVDGQDWEQVHSFAVPTRDVRDPHFLVFDGKIFVYCGAWLVDPNDSRAMDMNDHLGFCAWSEDGVTWQGPRMLEGTHGFYIWRAGTIGGKAYLLGRRVRGYAQIPDRVERDEATESWLLRSDDGFNWLPHGLIQPTQGNETAFVFQDDGSALALARVDTRKAGSTDERLPAQLGRARPPYTEWTLTNLNVYVGGPLLARWGDRYLAGGRKLTPGQPPVTALYWLVEDRLEEITTLPSGGDNSYPGFVPLSADKGLLSYYSSHEGSGTSLAPSAIYLAELSLEG